MTEHTQGPLHVGGDGTIIYDKAGWAVANATVFHGRQEPGTEQANARRIVACCNALEGFRAEELEQHGIDGVMFGTKEWLMRLEDQRDRSEAQVDWIEKVNTLHRQVEILYVVDGYTVTVTWDGHAISPDFHGATVEVAINKAMTGFDFDAPPVWVDGDRIVQDPVDRQLAAVEKQRDALLAALEAVEESPHHFLHGSAGHDEISTIIDAAKAGAK